MKYILIILQVSEEPAKLITKDSKPTKPIKKTPTSSTESIKNAPPPKSVTKISTTKVNIPKLPDVKQGVKPGTTIKSVSKEGTKKSGKRHSILSGFSKSKGNKNDEDEGEEEATDEAGEEEVRFERYSYTIS